MERPVFTVQWTRRIVSTVVPCWLLCLGFQMFQVPDDRIGQPKTSYDRDCRDSASSRGVDAFHSVPATQTTYIFRDVYLFFSSDMQLRRGHTQGLGVTCCGLLPRGNRERERLETERQTGRQVDRQTWRDRQIVYCMYVRICVCMHAYIHIYIYVV